jgi:non-canonical poly(A) RNA polymerase PAPD5/7
MIRRLEKTLRQDHTCSFTETIFGARVPILRCIEKKSNVQFDISFNSIEGYYVAKQIKRLSRKYPQLRPLALITKKYFQFYSLCNPQCGIFRSYFIILLIIRFLQQQEEQEKLKQPKAHTDLTFPLSLPLAHRTLPDLLSELFRFYGFDFDYQNLGISIIGTGSFYSKPAPTSQLSLENPQEPTEDLGRHVPQFSAKVSGFAQGFNALRSSPAPSVALLIPSADDQGTNSFYPLC